MLAFVDTKISKPEIIKQLKQHAKLDQIVKGQYWESGKGCAVGCTVHSGNHAEYEERFGIPQMLARLEDAIFEGLPNDKAMKWPIRFMEAVKPGSDLSLVGWKFLHWLLTDDKVNPGINNPLVRDAVKRCADVLAPLTNGKPVDESAARSAARSATWSAESAESAARSAARSAESAAWSAAWSAESAESAWSAARSAWSAAARSAAAYVRMADKLVLLIKAAPKKRRAA